LSVRDTQKGNNDCVTGQPFFSGVSRLTVIATKQ
jgi:hypothetical protein